MISPPPWCHDPRPTTATWRLFLFSQISNHPSAANQRPQLGFAPMVQQPPKCLDSTGQRNLTSVFSRLHRSTTATRQCRFQIHGFPDEFYVSRMNFTRPCTENSNWGVFTRAQHSDLVQSYELDQSAPFGPGPIVCTSPELDIRTWPNRTSLTKACEDRRRGVGDNPPRAMLWSLGLGSINSEPCSGA